MVWELGSNRTHSLEAPAAIEGAEDEEPDADANRHTRGEEEEDIKGAEEESDAGGGRGGGY